MGEEGDRKKYEHLKGLIAGKIKTGNPVRDDLIVSDAKKHMADLLSKRPNIDFEEPVEVPKEEVTETKEEPVEEGKVGIGTEEPKETKSKEKK